MPLWQTAWRHGIAFGTSAATWQLEDPDYARVVEHEAAILFTEDDLLWWRLRPTPDSALDFQYADQIMAFAERNRQLVLGAHLVWEEGFGEGWTEDDLWGMDEETAQSALEDAPDRDPLWGCKELRTLGPLSYYRHVTDIGPLGWANPMLTSRVSNRQLATGRLLETCRRGRSLDAVPASRISGCCQGHRCPCEPQGVVARQLRSTWGCQVHHLLLVKNPSPLLITMPRRQQSDGDGAWQSSAKEPRRLVGR